MFRRFPTVNRRRFGFVSRLNGRKLIRPPGMSVPVLNLRAVKPEDRAVTPPLTSRRSANDGGLFGVDVLSVTDVSALQSKLLEAQRVLSATEQRYERALEAKRQQVMAISAAMAELIAAGEDHDARGLKGTRVGRVDRGVQVGYPSVPSSLTTTPRSTRVGASSRPGMSVPLYRAQPPPSSRQQAYAPPPGRQGHIPNANVALASPRPSTRDGAVAAATPSSVIYRAYHPAPRRLATVATGVSSVRATTPRF